MNTIHRVMESVGDVVDNVGIGALTGMVVYGAMAGGRRIIEHATTLRRQLRDPVNLAVGGLAAVMAATLYNNHAPEFIDSVAEYVGMAASGAAFGAIVRSLRDAARPGHTFAQSFRTQARPGAIRGAYITPLAYGLLDAVDHVFK